VKTNDALPLAMSQILSVPSPLAEARTEDHARHELDMTAKIVQFAARVSIAQLDLPTQIFADHGPGGGGQVFAVRTEG
jgi:hypothetical protein